SLSFSMMQIMIAMSSQTIPLFEQMIFRNAVTMVFAFVSLRRKGIRNVFGHKENALLLLMRAVMGAVAMYLLFYATAYGNQGEVSILSKLSPFFVILLACIFLKEKTRAFQWIALVIAVTGAWITANPTFSGLSLPAASALGCSIFSGIAYFCINCLKGKEDPDVIVFDFSVFTTLVCVIITLFDFSLPSMRDFLLLMGMAVFAAIGQLTLTYSYTVANASEVSVFNYAGIPGSMILGFVILGQSIKTTTLIGSVLVIGSGIISFLGEGKVRKIQ
ncbi:MAG: DMT family transporter, partial [Spirochaetales bacterium]|nr:DMT family transporter [Spirochaetales bacterium]